MSATISREDWLAELLAAQSAEVDGFTMDELADRLGRSKRTCEDLMRRWARAGRVELAGRRKGLALNGVTCWTPVYRVVRK